MTVPPLHASASSSTKPATSGRGGKRPRRQQPKKHQHGHDDEEEEDRDHRKGENEEVEEEEDRDQEEQRLHEERVQRHQQLFLSALDSAVVSSGVLGKQDLYNLSQTSKAVLGIMRMRVLNISGGPMVLVDLEHFPSVRSVTVQFIERFEKEEPYTNATWSVPSGVDRMNLSQLHSIKIRVTDPIKRYTNPVWGIYGKKKKQREEEEEAKKALAKANRIEVEDPFEMMRPYLPPGLHSLTLEYNPGNRYMYSMYNPPVKSKTLKGFDAIINSLPGQSLLDLSLEPVDLDLLAQVIEQHRFPRLRSIKLTFFTAKDNLPKLGAAGAGAASRLLLGMMGMNDLRTVDIVGDFGTDASGQSVFTCLLSETNLNLSRFTTFTVVDPKALRTVDQFLSSNDSSWNHQAFGAILVASASRYGLQSYLTEGKDRKAMSEKLQVGMIRAPTTMRLHFLRAILAASTNGSSPYRLSRVWTQQETDQLLFLLEHVPKLDPCTGGCGPLMEHFMKWLSQSEVSKGLREHVMGKRATNTDACEEPSNMDAVKPLLTIAYNTFIGRPAIPSPPVRAAALTILAQTLDSFIELGDDGLLVEATGLSALQLTALLVRQQLSMSSWATATLSEAVWKLVKSKEGSLQSLIDTYGLGGDLCLLLINHSVPGAEDPLLADTLVEELLRKPKRFRAEWHDVVGRYLSRPTSYYTGKPTDQAFSQLIREKLFEKDRMERLWEMMVEMAKRTLSPLRSNPYRLLRLLRAIQHWAPELPSCSTAMSKIFLYLDLFKLLSPTNFRYLDEGGEDCDMFAEWVVKAFCGGPLAYLTTLVEKDLVSRVKKNGNGVRMSQQLMEAILVPLCMLPWNGDELEPSSVQVVCRLVDLIGEDLVLRVSKLVGTWTKIYYRRSGPSWKDKEKATHLFTAVAALTCASPRFAEMMVKQVQQSQAGEVDKTLLSHTCRAFFHFKEEEREVVLGVLRPLDRQRRSELKAAILRVVDKMSVQAWSQEGGYSLLEDHRNQLMNALAAPKKGVSKKGGGTKKDRSGGAAAASSAQQASKNT